MTLLMLRDVSETKISQLITLLELYVSILFICVLNFIIVKTKSVSSLTTFVSTVSVSGSGVLNKLSKQFAVYKSPYSGAFDLLDTQYIPRPCATSTVNITQMDYFYG